MPGRHHRTFFATPIGTATRNTVYTQQAAKPACQEDITVHFAAPIGTATPHTVYTQQAAKPACQENITVNFSQLLLAQLPTTQFTHSKLPNPHARKTPPYIFRSSYCNSYPEHSLHTASCQTRTPARHRRECFASPIGTATPNTVCTQQAAKPACQEDTAVHFSQLLLTPLPRPQFTHSKLPNPHARKTSPYIFRRSYWHSYPEHTLPNPHARKTPPYIFRSSYWHSYPQHSLHTASCQTRMPGRHRRTFSQLLLTPLPPTQFTHSKLPNPHARKTWPYIFRRSYWHSYPKHSLHTASCQTRMPGRHRRTFFPAPIGTATPNTVYTQQAAKPECQEDITVF